MQKNKQRGFSYTFFPTDLFFFCMYSRAFFFFQLSGEVSGAFPFKVWCAFSLFLVLVFSQREAVSALTRSAPAPMYRIEWKHAISIQIIKTATVEKKKTIKRGKAN